MAHRKPYKQNVLTHEIYLGDTKDPNKVTGHHIFMVYEAVWCPILEADTGGWYLVTQEFGWTFRYRAKHKSVFYQLCAGSKKPLQELIEEAASLMRVQYKILAAAKETTPA